MRRMGILSVMYLTCASVRVRVRTRLRARVRVRVRFGLHARVHVRGLRVG